LAVVGTIVDVILVSINRLSSVTTGYVVANEFLRWVDLLNCWSCPSSVWLPFIVEKQIEYDSPAREGRWHLVLNLTFIIGVYLLAASYGTHEVTNYLHVRFLP